MGQAGMTRRNLVLILLSFWLLIWGLSVGATYLTAPTGDGFMRGMNRLAILVGGQGVAALLAVFIFVISRPMATGDRLRRAAWVPLILAMLLVAAMVAPFVIVWLEGR